MDSSELTAEQLEVLLKAIAPARSYAHRLVKRMETRRFLQDDPLLVAARNVDNALHELWVRLHYAHCDRTRAEQEGKSGY
jgi:hypothetical protein